MEEKPPIQKIKYKYVTQPIPPKPGRKLVLSERQSKLCLVRHEIRKPKPKVQSMNEIRETGNLDNSLLTDDESDNSLEKTRTLFNPIFSSSSDDKQEPENSEQETFCSELENVHSSTLKKRNTGSESLFSTDSSERVSQAIEEHLSQDIDDLNLGENFTSQPGEPLLLSAASSVLESTLSKDSSYILYYNREIRPNLSNETLESYLEKGERGDSPEKTVCLDDTEDKTANNLDDTLDKTMSNDTCGSDGVLSVSSVASESQDSEPSVICVSDSEDEQHTKSSSELSKAVSSIVSSLNVTTSSEIDKFFNNIPNLGTPERRNYTRTFDPRSKTDDVQQTPPRRNETVSTHIKPVEEVIPESDPEPDHESVQSNSPIRQTAPPRNPRVQTNVFSASSSHTSKEVNVTTNIHISITVDVKSNETTDKKETTPGTKRKEAPSTSRIASEQTFRAPQFGRAKEKEDAKTMKNCQNEQFKAANDSIEVDEYTSQILDEIYGKDKWQTPQLKAKTIQRTNVDKSLLDFTTFDRSICANLESTRLTPLQHNTNSTKSQGSLKKVSKTVDKKPKTPALAICDPDTPSENETSDESWKNKSSNSTDSEDAQTKKRTQKRVVSKKRVIRPPSYSGSDNDIDEAWTDKNVRSPLSNALDNCQYKQKEKLPATPITGAKTKRKLFNPNKTYDELMEEPQMEKKNNSDMDHDISQIKEDALSFCFDFPLMPKAVERIKNKECNKTPIPKSKKKLCIPKSPSTKRLGFLQSLDVNTSEEVCDPEALRFRRNYKSLKTELTEKLYALYNELVFENELVAPCSWNKKLLNTAGRCHLTRIGGTRKSRIELSEKVLTSADRLRCTLIHEMCHAATWVYNGEDGHGKTWKAWAHKANTVFHELPKINTCHSYEIFYKYTYMCKLCKAKSQAHSRSKKVAKIRCKLCHGEIQILLNKMNKEGQVVSTPVKSATGFAKFVKENYSKVKRPNVAHAEVMKMLGEGFGKLTVEQKAAY